MTAEKLEVWEPLKDNPFSRFYKEMSFFEMHHKKDFVLVFQETLVCEETYDSNLYTFTYETENAPQYPIITFRYFDEMTRPDIEGLISKVGKGRAAEGLSKLSYEPTFYKVHNSKFLAWYDSIYPARVALFPNAEHHLYITSDFILEVLSEYEPTVSITTKK